MNVMWSASQPMPVREVRQRINVDRDLAYTTVQTVMDVLWRKGWLSRTKQGRAYVYAAAGTREDYVSRLLDDALSDSPDRAAALVRFVERMEPDEVRELRRAWEMASQDRTAGRHP